MLRRGRPPSPCVSGNVEPCATFESGVRTACWSSGTLGRPLHSTLGERGVEEREEQRAGMFCPRGIGASVCSCSFYVQSSGFELQAVNMCY